MREVNSLTSASQSTVKILHLCGFSMLLFLVACKAQDGDSMSLESLKSIAIDSPISEVEARCPERRCQLEKNFFKEVEFTPDAAGKIKAVVLRCPIPTGGVQAGQEHFERIRGVMRDNLGKGESFLASGDPTYWPGRRREDRVVTLTIDNSDRTIIAIGPAGPDAATIPATGTANNRQEVQKFWQKIAAIATFSK